MEPLSKRSTEPPARAGRRDSASSAAPVASGSGVGSKAERVDRSFQTPARAKPARGEEDAVSGVLDERDAASLPRTAHRDPGGESSFRDGFMAHSIEVLRFTLFVVQ
jgi:hypothetical protein